MTLYKLLGICLSYGSFIEAIQRGKESPALDWIINHKWLIAISVFLLALLSITFTI